MIQVITEVKVGDRIHSKLYEGIFTIINVDYNGVHISCKAWIARANHPKIIPTKYLFFNDIKCLAGGINAPRRVIKKRLYNTAQVNS